MSLIAQPMYYKRPPRRYREKRSSFLLYFAWPPSIFSVFFSPPNMLFNSLQFAWFLVLVYGIFTLSPHRWRNLILLAASCYFYAAFIPKYLLILFAVIILDYAAALIMERWPKKKFLLITSLIANIGILGVFKYFDFFADNVNDLAQLLGWNYSIQHLAWVLPIGLSFHTFQSMSYTIEVYRGNQKAERNLLVYALYVLYFPQLVAGPIERPQHMLLQFRKIWHFDYARARSGLQLMASGFLKKCVVADTLAILVNQAYGNYPEHQGLSLLLASYFFAWQIFCDFSGYTDIARGTSRLFGIELMLNFNKPYLAQSFSEFWRRWHISLSTWFRDYLYLPLGGNRTSHWRHSFNLFVVFLVSGLWHGANWTFVAWGALHWLLLTQVAQLLQWSKSKILRIIFVFHGVTLGWIFFRATSIHEATAIIYRIFTAQPGSLSITKSQHFSFAILCVVAMILFQYLDEKKDLWAWLNKQATLVRWSAYATVIFVFFLFGQFTNNQFIYFQF